MAVFMADFGERDDAGAECGVIRQLVQAGDRADGLPAGLLPAGRHAAGNAPGAWPPGLSGSFLVTAAAYTCARVLAG